MRCLICKKSGEYVEGVRIDVIACKDHAQLYHRLEAQYKARRKSKTVYKSGRRIR